MKIVLLTGVILLLVSCGTSGKPDSGVWRFDAERTRDKIRPMFNGRVSEDQLDKIVLHFKQNPPELEVTDGKFEMRRLIKKTGSFSGTCEFVNDTLRLHPSGKDAGWEGHYGKFGYDKNRDEYTLAFVFYPIVLSRVE